MVQYRASNVTYLEVVVVTSCIVALHAALALAACLWAPRLDKPGVLLAIIVAILAGSDGVGVTLSVANTVQGRVLGAAPLCMITRHPVNATRAPHRLVTDLQCTGKPHPNHVNYHTRAGDLGP